MADRNQKAKDMAKVTKNFDQVYFALDDMATATEGIMPLVSDTLRLAMKLVKLYKQGFKAGLK